VIQYRFHPQQVSMSKREQQSLSIVAAQHAAAARRNGVPDPLDTVEAISPETLEGLGIAKAEHQRRLAFDRQDWIRNMCMAGENAMALEAAREALEVDSEHLERKEIAELHLLAARLSWKQSHPMASMLSAARAVLAHPVMVGRPLKPLLRRLGMA